MMQRSDAEMLQERKAYQHQEDPAAGLNLPVCWLHCLQLPILPACPSALWPHLRTRLALLGITAGSMLSRDHLGNNSEQFYLLPQSAAL